ncbi:MAG: tetratricopeptide repeat protein [Bacteroidaceae bacterium]|nr:tetratricopeptide repeat protein [Bacteroidaceae bacterium]
MMKVRGNGYCCVVAVMLVYVAALMSCGGSNGRLAEVERLLETDPVRADSLLSTFPVPESRKGRALYAILRTQADYKNYKDIPDDRLIREATGYYGNRRKDYHAAMAWYSRGCVLSLTDDDLGAINSYLTAKDLFPDTLVRYYLICEHNLGKQYLQRHMYAEADRMLNACLENTRTLKDSVTMAYCEYNLALLDLYERRFERAERAFRRLADNRFLSPMLCTEAYLQLSKIQLHHYGNTDSALRYVNRYIDGVGFESGAGYSIKADAFYAAGQYDSAYFYYRKSLGCDLELSTESNNYSRLPELSLKMGLDDEALSYMEHYKDCLVRQNERYGQDSITVIHLRHNLEVYELRRKEVRKRYIIITCSTILIVGLGLILAYLYNETRRRREYERLRDSMVRRRIQKDIGMDNMEEALKSSSRVFRDSYGYNLLSELAADDREPVFSERAVIKHDMELYFEKVIDMMRREVPSLSETEISYCIYRYLGVNWRLSMELVNRSSSYAGRLKQYIQKKIPAEWMRLFFQQ